MKKLYSKFRLTKHEWELVEVSLYKLEKYFGQMPDYTWCLSKDELQKTIYNDLLLMEYDSKRKYL